MIDESTLNKSMGQTLVGGILGLYAAHSKAPDANWNDTKEILISRLVEAGIRKEQASQAFDFIITAYEQGKAEQQNLDSPTPNGKMDFPNRVSYQSLLEQMSYQFGKDWNRSTPQNVKLPKLIILMVVFVLLILASLIFRIGR